ncbi:MAG: hypothetical protein M3530_01385, partial [Thermoproteota archaeon]|nr:hypothetical protein [Thermoproteota archaeon]
DLSFIQKECSVFSRSMDIGSFLASVIGLETDKYEAIETGFFAGYKFETNKPFPYLSIAIRNFLSIGLSPSLTIFKNMANNSVDLI